MSGFAMPSKLIHSTGKPGASALSDLGDDLYAVAVCYIALGI